MKKLLIKDKKRRKITKTKEKYHFIFKTIINNYNFSSLIRFNALKNLKKIAIEGSKVSINNRCLYTFNKKRFNILTNFSRHVFLKLIRSGNVGGLRKVSW